jgi:hypothetical protein
VTHQSDDRDRRASQRVRVRFPVTFTGRNIQGCAFARNISVSGALLEDAEPLLITGGRIRVRFSLFPESLPIEATAIVVRETENGFAIRFVDMDGRFRSVLRRAIKMALSASPGGGDDDDEERTLLDIDDL